MNRAGDKMSSAPATSSFAPWTALPPEIRRVHIAEIFDSNFLFGVIAAGLLVRRMEAAAPLTLHESTC